MTLMLASFSEKSPLDQAKIPHCNALQAELPKWILQHQKVGYPTGG